MHELAKGFIVLGAALIATGLILLFLPKGSLPGDIIVKRETFTFSFPLATSIVVSIIISGILYLIGKFR